MANLSAADQMRETGRAGSIAALARAVPAALTLLAVAACSQAPIKSADSKIDPVWGVERAKKIVKDGDPIPPGGGRYQVGKPYMVGGRMYFPHEDANYDKVGNASWYGDDDNGRETANGEVYDKASLSAAHPTLPIPSYARVTNLDNGRSVLVRINDRGPYVGNRLVDVSERTADLLGFKGRGLGHVRLQYVGPAPIEGSDQRMLVASLRGPGASPSIAQDRSLIAQADRSPSDGRMTGLALAREVPVPAIAPAKPVVLAAATERETSYVTRSAAQPVSYGTQKALPPPPRVQPAQIAIAPTQPYQQRAQMPPTIGTLSSRSLAPAGTQAPSHIPSSLQPLPRDEEEGDAAPLQLSPSAPAPAPGAIGRAPASSDNTRPSRYGPPSGQIVYRFQSQGFMAEATPSAAEGAIDRLIAANIGPMRPHIDLGSYSRPENAARVAELMHRYGDVTTTAVHGGLGEKLTQVQLTPISAMAPGDVIGIADRLGIHSATLVE